MKKINIFLSSAMNGELDDERKSITQLFKDDEVLQRFYDFYAIENTASPHPIEKSFLDEVSRSDVLICIFKNTLRIAVKKEYDKARDEGKKVFIYLYKDDSKRDKDLKDFISTELYKYDPGFFDSTYQILENIKQDIHNDFVDTYKATIGPRKYDVLRQEMTRTASFYQYFSKEVIDKNKDKYQNMSADQFVILAQEIREKTGNYYNALLISEIGISLFPDNWQLLNNRGIILDEMGLSKYSLYSYQKALKLNNSDETILYNLGNYYYNKQDYINSIKYYLLALETNPNKTNALNKLSLSYRYLNKIEEFLLYAEKAYSIEKSEMYIINYIIALADCNRVKEAKSILENEIGNKNKKYKTTLAYILWKSNKTEDIILLLGHGENLEYWDLALILFESYLIQNKVEEALKSLEVMGDILIFQPEDLNNFGYLLQKHGYIEQSNELLLKAISFNPSFLEPRITLVSNYANSGRYDDALDLCNQSLEMYPYEPKLIRNKYLIYYYQNDMKTAFKFLFEKTFSVTGLSDQIPDGILETMLKQL